MLLIKEGFPEDGDLVLCKVTKVSFNSVFVNIEMYGKQGMIHISEVSPGRIRSLNDYVKVDKQVVCKVLKINQEKGYIDLSLRRVNENQKRKTLNKIKLEEKAEKIIIDVAKELKQDVKLFYKKVSAFAISEYDSVYPLFEAVIEEDYDFSEQQNLTPEEVKALDKVIRERIKPKQVEIVGDIMVKTYAENGLEIVKKALQIFEALEKEVSEDTLHALQSSKKEPISVKYLGSGKFKLRMLTHDYLEGEKLLKKGISEAEAYCQKNDAEFSFSRINKK